MPKLCKLYFSRVGHPAARLDGVTIPFVDAEGMTPVDTLIDLRNGGGKTSTVQLYFSNFITSQKEFAGQTRSGDMRSFDKYFQVGEVGFIVSEWTEDNGRGPRRVIGQCVQKKNADGSDIVRVFFSFLVPVENAPLRVEELPLRQFKDLECEPANPGNIASADQFAAWFKERVEGHPEIDSISVKTQHVWRDWLGDRGYDDQVFRLQLQLNQAEGSSEMLLNDIKSVEAFVTKLIELTTDDDHYEPLQNLIKEHRGYLRELPRYKQEMAFLRELGTHFQTLITPGQELLQHQEARHVALSTRASVGRRVLATRPQLARQQQETEDEHAALLSVQSSVDDQNKTLGAEVGWLLCRQEEFRLQEAQAALLEAEASKARAQEDLQVLRGTTALALICADEDRAAGIRSAISEASRPIADLHVTLNDLGAALVARYDQRLAHCRDAIEAGRTRLAKLKQSITAIDTEKGETQNRIGDQKATLRAVRTWLKEAGEHRVRLRQEGVFLSTTESTNEAATRLQAGNEALAQHIKETEEKLALHASQIELAKEQRREVLNDQRQRLAQRQVLTDELERFTEAEERISTHAAIREAIEADGRFDPYQPGLEAQIEDQLGCLEREKLRHEMELLRGQVDSEMLCGSYGLLPPNDDVLRVIEALEAADIPAAPYYRHLAEDHRDPAGIRALLCQDPARYGGVLLRSAKDLERARPVVQELPHLRCPVQITPAVTDEGLTSPSAAAGLIATPKSDAPFNRAAAYEYRLQTETDRGQLQDQLRRLEGAIPTLRLGQGDLKQFLFTYPDGYRESKERLLGNHDEDLALLATKLEETEEALRTHGAAHTTTGATLKTGLEDNLRLRESQRRLADYTERYDEPFNTKLAEETSLAASLDDLQERLAQLLRDAEALAGKQQNENSELVRAEESEKLLRAERAAVTYTDGKAETQGANSFEQVQAAYRSAKEVWDRESMATQRLEGELSALQQAIVESRQRFQKEFGRLDLAAIETRRLSGAVTERELTTATELAEQATQAIGGARSVVTATQQHWQETRRAHPAALQPDEVDFQFDQAGCIALLNGRKLALEAGLQRSNELTQRIPALSQARDALAKDLRRLDALLTTVRKVLGADELFAEPFEDLDACQRQWEAATADLEEVSGLCASKESEVQRIIGRITETLMAERHLDLLPQLRADLLAGKETMHRQAQDFMRRIEEFIDSHQTSLNSITARKSQIVDFLAAEMENLHRKLDLLNHVTRIPENNGGWNIWSGVAFVKFDCDKLKKNGEEHIRVRMEAYLDRLIDPKADYFPSKSMVIVQEAARSFFRGDAEIRILKPSVGPDLKRYSLSEALGAFSDGERLTASLLIAMCLARLISYDANIPERGGSTLIVDNPIGKSNSSELIQLQRLAAKTFGVQLIYPTGIRDLQTSGEFPRVVTLRNSVYDVRTGFKHITAEEVTTPPQKGVVDSISVQFSEEGRA